MPRFLQIARYFASQETPFDQSFSMLPMQPQMAYEIVQIATEFGKESVLTASGNYQLMSIYTVKEFVSETTNNQGLIARHAYNYEIGATVGSQLIKTKNIIQQFDHLVIPFLTNRLALAGGGSYRWECSIQMRRVRLSQHDYLDLLHMWDVDLDVEGSAKPVRFRVN